MNNSEINKVKIACSITVKILKKLIRKLNQHKFKTELEISNFLKQQTKVNNCNLAFEPIAAIGKNAAEMHHKPNNSIIKQGFLVIDFGVKYKNYCSDCTRTFYIGNPTKKETVLYNLLLSAQETALMYAQPGVHAADIDLIARAVLQDYYKHFIHGTGHGLGKKIHKAPNLSPKGKSILKKGDVLTIEPGLYFKNKLGIRIEDTIVLKTKPIILTKLTKKLIIIK